MKKIAAIIHPHKLNDVKIVLLNAGIIGMTICDTKGFGRQKGQTTRYRGHEHRIEFVGKIRIEVVVEEEKADLVVGKISLAGRTGEIGDGKIMVTPIEEIIRIRTGERGLAAV